MKKKLTTLVMFCLAFTFFLSTAANASAEELGIRGIGMSSPDPENGKAVFEALIGVNVTTNELNYIPIKDVNVKVYDDIGSRVIEDYANETPIFEGKTTAPYIFDQSAELGVDKYRNFRVEIDGFVNKDRDLFFVANQEGYEMRGSQGFITPVKKYTVVYTDGVDGEVLFTDQTYPDLFLNSNTPQFVGDPSREGFTFSGWEPEIAEKVTENVTYQATWTSIINKFTATFNSNGGTHVAPQTVDEGESFTKPANPSLSGYTFEGWFIDEELSILYDFQTPANQNITLYAKWKKLPEEVKIGKVEIKYQDENGEEIHAPYSVTGDVGDNFNLNQKYLLEIPNYQYVKTIGTPEGKFIEKTQEVIYVYKYVEKNTSDDSSKLVKPSKPAKKPVKKSLPKTGEQQTIVPLLLGTILIFVASVIYYIKRKTA